MFQSGDLSSVVERRGPWARVGTALLVLPLLLLTGLVAGTTTAVDAWPDTFASTFRDDLVVDNLTQPTSMEFLPDGRMLVTEKPGTIAIVDFGAVLPGQSDTYLALPSVDSAGEHGVLNVILDPNFAANNFIYVFYTTGESVSRVERFTHVEGLGGVESFADPNSGVTIWESSLPLTSCCHVGGGLAVDTNGFLYITTGEDFDVTQSQDLTNPGGKVHRVRLDGSIPEDNPYFDGPGPNIDSIWAYGLRNPFRAQWDPINDRLLIGEVGGNNQTRAHEDIHVGRAGANYGWPECGDGTSGREADGSCTDDAFDDPWFTYPHAGSQASVTGGVIYDGDAFPSDLIGDYFFGDFSNGWIRTLDIATDGSVNSVSDFGQFPGDDASNVVDFEVGPDGALYFVQIAGSFPVGSVANSCEGGCIRRVVYESGNRAPSISALDVTPLLGPAPLDITASVTASDLDNDTLSYEWDFGDGTTATGASVSHTFTAPGVYTVRALVSDASETATASVSVSVGTPPTINITSPVDQDTFRAGDTLDFAATAVDGSGNPIPAGSVSWTVKFRHLQHEHPVLGPQAGATASYFVPTTGHDYHDSTAYLVTFSATDSFGITSSETITVLPDKVDISLATQPPGLDLRLDGIPVSDGYVYDNIIGFEHTVSAANQCVGDVTYLFDSWSDGGAASHSVVLPEGGLSLTANFTAAGSCEVPIAGLSARYEADNGVLAANGQVTSWADLTGTDVNSLVPDGTAPSLVVGGLNGQDYVSFDGVSDALLAANATGLPTGSSDRTVMLVARYDSPGWGGVSWGEAAPNRAFGVGVTSSPTAPLGIQGWGLLNDNESASDALGDGWLLQSVLVENNQVTHYRNLDQVDSFLQAYNTDGGNLAIAREIDGAPHVDMDLAAALIWDRALTPAEFQLVQDYLITKYLTAGPDNEAPTIPAGQEFSVAAGAAVNSTFGVVSASDNLAVTGFNITSGDPGGVFSIGSGGTLRVIDNTSLGVAGDIFTLGIEVADAAGNTAQETITVNVVDSTGLPAGLVLQLETDQGLLQNDLGLTTWVDQSPFNNDVSGGGSEPTVVIDSLNGLPAIEFDGVNDALTRNNPTGLPMGSSDRTVIKLVQYDGSGWGGTTWGRAAPNEAFGVGVASSPGLAQLAIQGWGAVNDFPSANDALNDGWIIQSVVMDDNTLVHYNDGELIQSFAHQFNTASDLLVLGAEIDGAPAVDMSLGAVLVWDRALTASERLLVESYLASKYIPAVSDTVDPVVASGQAFVVEDSETSGGLVGTVVASDNVGVTDFAIVAGNSVGAFAIDQAGEITVANAAALVAGDEFTLIVEATDAAGNTGSAAVIVVVEEGGTAAMLPVGAVFVLEADSGLSETGGVVASWADSSGNANTLDVVAGNPTVGQSPSGLPAVVFDGDGDYLERTGALTGLPSGGGDRTVIMLADYRSTGYGGFAWGSPSEEDTFGLTVDTFGDLAIQAWGPLDNPSTTTGTNTGWLVQSATTDGSTVTHYRDGLEIDSFDMVYTTSLERIVLGAEIDRDPSLEMSVAAVVVYDRVLTPAERARAEAYLTGKYLGTGTGDTTAPVINPGQAFATLTTAATGTVLGQISATDNVGVVAYNITAGDAGGAFAIDGTGELSVVDGAVLASGGENTYSLTVEAADAAGNTGSEVVAVVASLDQIAPVVVAGQSFGLTTDAATGASIGVVTAVDNVGVTDFQISAGDAAGVFAIDSAGQLTVGDGGALAAGGAADYVLTVVASDAIGNQGTATVQVSVSAGGGVLPGGLVLSLEGDSGLLASGGVVSSWADGSGLGNDLTSGGAPSLGVSPSGAPAVVFDGVDDVLERVGGLAGLPAGSDARSVFVVADYRSGGGGFNYGDVGTGRTFGVATTNGGNLRLKGWGGSGFDFDSGVPGVGAGWLVQSVTYGGGAFEHVVDGVLIDSGSASFGTVLDRVVLGADIDQSPFVDMSVGAVLVFDRELSAVERGQVEAYLTDKYLVEDPSASAVVRVGGSFF